MVKPLIIRNASVWNGKHLVQRPLYTAERVAAHLRHDAHSVDLDGYTIFPGSINAHDHLELNHFPRTKFREKYDNAHQWGEDVSTRLNDEPFKSLRAYPLWDRLFIGGLKNLLCGATSVAHHNPPHKELFRPDFPVRVLRHYTWAHSLHFTPETEIVRAFRATSPDVPWFIHLAEGTDEIAAGEYKRLNALGCIGSNTVIVHGVGLTDEDIADAAPKVRALVVCPSTNRYLLGAQPPITKWGAAGGDILFGSDSRLTADGDLLDEVQLFDAERTAQLLGFVSSGYLRSGGYADFIAFKTNTRFRKRADLALIVLGGVPQIGAPDVMLKFPTESIPAKLDGVPKRINIDLAGRIARCTLKESGLELDALPNPRRKTFIGLRP
jgi:hypothetical protein